MHSSSFPVVNNPMASRMAQQSKWNLLVFWLATAGATAAESVPARLTVEPETTVLNGRRASAQLIATGFYGDGSVRDLTRAATWTSTNPAIVMVDAGGLIEPRSDGEAEVHVRTDSTEAKTIVRVRNVGRVQPVQFVHEVLPALTKAGCNAGACHGTPAGKNGFRLSLRGYNPALDFQTLARERFASRQPARARGQPDPP